MLTLKSKLKLFLMKEKMNMREKLLVKTEDHKIGLNKTIKINIQNKILSKTRKKSLKNIALNLTKLI